jgi:hypothetical protein
MSAASPSRAAGWALGIILGAYVHTAVASDRAVVYSEHLSVMRVVESMPATAAPLRKVITELQRGGMAGRVVVSHAYALGQVEADIAKRAAHDLAEAGVFVFSGSDNVRDAWCRGHARSSDDRRLSFEILHR